MFVENLISPRLSKLESNEKQTMKEFWLNVFDKWWYLNFMLARPAPVSSVPGRGGPGAASVSAVARAGADSEHQASVSAGLTPAPVTHRPAPRISSYANITTQSQSIRQNVNQHHHSFKHLSELSHKLIVIIVKQSRQRSGCWGLDGIQVTMLYSEVSNLTALSTADNSSNNAHTRNNSTQVALDTIQIY